MELTHDLAKLAGQAVSHVHAGVEKLASRKLCGAMPATLQIESPTFSDGATLPFSSTADGAGVPPPLAWSGVPPAAKSLALLCEDPDAPFPEPFVHWLVYDIPATTSTLAPSPCNVGHEGKNSKLATGFTGAAPPPGHGLHHYHFQLFALDTPLDLDAGTGRSELLDQMQGHVLAWGERMGTYERA